MMIRVIPVGSEFEQECEDTTRAEQPGGEEQKAAEHQPLHPERLDGPGPCSRPEPARAQGRHGPPRFVSPPKPRCGS